MSASNRSFRGRNNSYHQDRPRGDAPENVGNRRTFEELKIPPDDVGNHAERDTIATFVHDNLGNSLDEEPSHLQSGILSQLIGAKTKATHRRSRDSAPQSQKWKSAPVQPARGNYGDRDRTERSDRNDRGGRTERPSAYVPSPPSVTKDPATMSADEYMAHLSGEFTRLMRLRLGVPFSFAMKPVTDGAIDEDHLHNMLSEIEKLIGDILASTAIVAEVSFIEYGTAQHRFAVFYVSPKEKDPVKNKDLISALRQIVKLHATKNPPGQVNVLLVLANAQNVIEDHLFKLGAKRID